MRYDRMIGATALCALLAGCLPEIRAEAGQTETGGSMSTPTGRGTDAPLRSEEIPEPRLQGPASDRLIFDQAVAQDSNAALILFLARNPASPQAPEARRLLAQRRSPDAPGTALAVAGSDADVVAAFDAARLSGDPAAWTAFLSRHGSHPLAAEARLLAGG